MAVEPKAMAVAIAYPDAEHGGDRKSSSKLELEKDIHKGRLSQARKILRLTPLQAVDVMSGELPFSTVSSALKGGPFLLNRAITSRTSKLRIRDCRCRVTRQQP